MLYHDPALVFRCDLPWGWCLDSESSLFRIVFRPWDRLDEKMIVAARPVSLAPNATDAEWTAAIDADTDFEASRSTRLAAGTARIFRPAVIEGRTIRRIIRRGPLFDLTIDHQYAGESHDEPAPAHLRIASTVRAPVVSLLQEPTPPLPLDEASNTVTSLPSSATAQDYYPALAAEELAAKTVWVKSLRHGSIERVDANAFDALLRSRVMRASLGPDVWLLLQAHGTIVRVASRNGDPVPQELLTSCGQGHLTICAILRRHPRAASQAGMPDDVFGSRTFLQQLMANLLTDEARDRFQKDERVRHDALADAVLASLFAMSRWARADKPWPAELLAGETWGLGRTLTAFSDAAKYADDADAALEASDGLSEVGDRLLTTPEDVPDGSRFRAQGLMYKATAASAVASVLTAAGDQASLERALTVVDESMGLLRQAPKALVERTNMAHVEALAALQLGDVGRAREAVERGLATGRRLHNHDYPVKFFGWVERAATLIANQPAAIRSLPQLQYEVAVADSGRHKALSGVCAALQREMADDITSTTTLERLSVAARLLEGTSAADTLLAAAEGLIDLKRLLLSGRSDLQIGYDDSRLARDIASDRVAQFVHAGDLASAVLGADRARARALLGEFVLSPGETEGLREVIADGVNPAVAMAAEAAARARVPEPLRHVLRVPDPWSGPPPFGMLRASTWLKGHAERTREWVHKLLAGFGARSLTSAELLETVATLGHPVLMLHPTGDRIALFVVLPDATIHHAMSAATVGEVQQRAQTFRREGTKAADFHAAARAIYKALVAPVKQHLSSQELLTVCPYRELSAIPFALVEDERGIPLVERCAVSVIPSIATLSLLRERTGHSNGPATALVIGDPATTRLRRLPGAAAEARAVEATLRAAHPDIALGLLLDADATPAAFLKRARGARLLHLACHAVVDDSAQQSALYFAQDATGDDRLDRPDILQAPLTDALVFLSACRSGAGRPAAEGTLGLAREFLRAGARAVVASHWNVPDDITARLVERFYTSFAGTHRDVATALRMAMRETRWDLEHVRKRARTKVHPATWGGFFVLGDGTLRDAM